MNDSVPLLNFIFVEFQNRNVTYITHREMLLLKTQRKYFIEIKSNPK
jgi:hypothetical protein